MGFETTAGKIWKRLPREDKKLAATAFLEDPPPELFAGALSAVIRVRKLRPQVARALSREALADALSTVLDPGEPLVSSLLIALHLGSRRPLLVAFLEAVGLPHENGLLKEEADAFPVPAAEALRKAATAIAPTFPREHIEVYFNTLILQDPDRWQGLAGYEGWLTPPAG
jgi:DNA-binding phage protein